MAPTRRRRFLAQLAGAAVLAPAVGALSPGRAANGQGDAATPAVPRGAFIDANTLPADHEIEAGLCIVGAGAAGIAIAHALAGTGIDVVLLESGGLEFEDETQALYEGEETGDRDVGLAKMRLRYFGGTTNHWAGNCRPLDPIDFKARSWVPLSGWPVSHGDLVPFYKRAEAICQTRAFDYDQLAWRSGANPAFPFGQDAVLTTPYRRSPPTRFGPAYRAVLRDAPNITTILHANLVEIVTTDNTREVSRLAVATSTGKPIRVRARHYVLAAGGIENARLLLSSDSVARGGLGNGRDLVGRYFTDHPLIKSGAIFPSNRDVSIAVYDYDHIAYGVLALPEAVQRRERLLNCTIGLQAVAVPAADGVSSMKTVLDSIGNGDVPPRFFRHLRNIVGDIDDVAAAGYRKLRGRSAPVRLLRFHSRVEVAPNPESRVTLGPDRDRLGQRRVRLDWRFGAPELASLRRVHELIGQEAARIGFGAVHVDLGSDAPLWPMRIAPSGHHIGTTRMHGDPGLGVVDANCRVHGMANLHVAGSSVFPTSGASNPTFTIVALALRLADRLKAELG